MQTKHDRALSPLLMISRVWVLTNGENYCKNWINRTNIAILTDNNEMILISIAKWDICHTT